MEVRLGKAELATVADAHYIGTSLGLLPASIELPNIAFDRLFLPSRVTIL
jgi:hypothetical protein